jgi:hypothetical protein
LRLGEIASSELAAINPPREISGMEFRPVSPDTLQKLAAEHPDGISGEALKEVGRLLCSGRFCGFSQCGYGKRQPGSEAYGKTI